MHNLKARNGATRICLSLMVYTFKNLFHTYLTPCIFLPLNSVIIVLTKLANKLPETNQSSDDSREFRKVLNNLLLSHYCYSVDEFSYLITIIGTKAVSQQI